MTTRGGPFSGIDPRTIRRRATKMLLHLGMNDVELSVALVDDATIRELNHAYRGNDRATDVLAFAMREGEEMASSDVELLGDVIISVPTAKRQARRRPLLDEMTMLVAHGLLHLLGYDHQSDTQEKEMTARTRELEAAASRR